MPHFRTRDPGPRNNVAGREPSVPRGSPSSLVLHRLLALLRARRHSELSRELLRAEVSGELCELDGIILHAVLAAIEGSPLVSDYLEMARAVALSADELELVDEIAWAISDGLALASGSAISARVLPVAAGSTTSASRGEPRRDRARKLRPPARDPATRAAGRSRWSRSRDP